MDKSVNTSDLFEYFPSFLADFFKSARYPWELIPKIKELALSLLESGIEDYTLLKSNVLVGKDVKIYDGVTVEGPAIIGSQTEIRPGAFIRGSVIVGEGCVIGNSTELKNCILLSSVQVPHYNYVGDSILGNRAHLGAGTICSNLRSDHNPVIVHADKEYPTGLRKMGGILGDGADVGCGSVINPGTVIGKNTTVYPLTSLRGVYPADCIVKSTDIFVKREKR
ncbi:MAG: UDP-N-acetylglucosamine pyrophosphorylase [Clostridia bacterium]|nr:UDP-N-acetylglucosamine pyrophosphorylase [Clostridia bacterium]